MKTLQLRPIPPMNASAADVAGAQRYDVPDGPFYVAHMPRGASREDIDAIKRQLDALRGTTVVLPPGWRFQVLVPDTAADSAAAPTCGSCGATLTVDGCTLCEARGGLR